MEYAWIETDATSSKHRRLDLNGRSLDTESQLRAQPGTLFGCSNSTRSLSPKEPKKKLGQTNVHTRSGCKSLRRVYWCPCHLEEKKFDGLGVGVWGSHLWTSFMNSASAMVNTVSLFSSLPTLFGSISFSSGYGTKDSGMKEKGTRARKDKK